MPTPAEVLAALVGADPAGPRLTWYDDAADERLEFSAAVLANWVAKAANLLQDDADVGVGGTVALALPTHWRALYWAMATWSVGATLVVEPFPEAPCDVLVGCDPAVTGTDAAYAVHVTLAALARVGADTPPGAVDEARELATYGDRFTPDAAPAPHDPALRSAGTLTAYRDVVPDAALPPSGARVLVAGPLDWVLRTCLAAWAVDGSVVLLADGSAADTARRAAERVSVDARSA